MVMIRIFSDDHMPYSYPWLCSVHSSTVMLRVSVNGHVPLTTAIAVSEEDAGGVGGAVHTGEGAETIFRNKGTFRKNTCGLAGGAVHTAGVTRLQRGATFNGSQAAVSKQIVSCARACITLSRKTNLFCLMNV